MEIRKLPGFTMIETLVAMAVLGIFFSSVSIIIQLIIQNVGSARVRSTALAVAMQKMELIRNLPYAQIGTVGGIPAGAIVPSEQVTINTLVFTVTTSILYYDDSFDGVAPTDTLPDDYKRIRVQVTWGGAFPSRLPITLVSEISPNGIETTAGGGTIMINVFNGAGLAVPNATVSIDNTAVNPAIHMQTLSDANGLIVIPGAPACVTCYQITVTKTGYSTDKTYSTTEVANPTQPYTTVIAGHVTPLSFAIDQVSTLLINSYNQSYQPISNVLFTIRGNKIIGHDTQDNPIYKYQRATSTGGWSITIPSLEWDTYNLDFSSSLHMLAGSNPLLPVALLPNSTQTLSIVAVPKANMSLLVKVKNSAGILQSSASATLSNLTLYYTNTQITPSTGSANYGQVYYGSLSSGAYNLLVTLPGYQVSSSSVTINTNQQTTVSLNQFVP